MVTRLWTSTDFLSNRASFGLYDRCRANLAQFFSLVYCCLAADEDDCGDCVLWNSDWIPTFIPNDAFSLSFLFQYMLIFTQFDFILRLKALYDIRPKSDEIEMITKYQQENPHGKGVIQSQ